MSSLKRVTGVHIQCRPPEGLQLPRLEKLVGSVYLSGADTGRLLAACPYLGVVVLEVVPREGQQTSSGAGAGSSSTSNRRSSAAAAAAAAAATPALSLHDSLSLVTLNYRKGTAAQAAAAHFAAAAPVLGSIDSLDLTWPQSKSRSSRPHLPRLAALRALTQLSLEAVGEGGCVLEEDMLVALQPLNRTLEEVSLKNFPLVTPRLVLALQGVLPALQVVKMCGCGRLVPRGVKEQGREEEDQLDLLQRFVRPKLTLEVDET
jgi:hypothetical protein